MRASDQVLHDDLIAAGLPALAARAATGEWNDYFGEHTMPQNHLIEVLRAEVAIANVVRKQLIANVVDGKYDGTHAEGTEWAKSIEGQDAFRDLMRGESA